MSWHWATSDLKNTQERKINLRGRRLHCFSVSHHSLLRGLVKVKVKWLSCVRLFVTPWTVTHQAPPSMGFSRQEYWSGLPFPSPGDLPNPGIKSRSPALQADALTSEAPGKSGVLILFK